MYRYLYILVLATFSMVAHAGENTAHATAALMADAAMPLLLDSDSTSIEKRVGEILLSGNMDLVEDVEVDASFQTHFSPKTLQQIKARGINEVEFKKRVIKGDLTGARELVETVISPAEDLSEDEEETAQKMARRARQGILYRNQSEQNDEEKVEEDVIRESKKNVTIVSDDLDATIQTQEPVKLSKPVPRKLDDDRLRALGIKNLPGVSIFRLAKHAVSNWRSKNLPSKRPSFVRN